LHREKLQGNNNRKINAEECLKLWGQGETASDLAKKYHTAIKTVEHFLVNEQVAKYKDGVLIRINTADEFNMLRIKW